MIEESGLWRDGYTNVVTKYCSPGTWASGLTADEHNGEDVYLEYEPVVAVLNLSTNTLTEHSLGEAPLRHLALQGSNAELNRMGSGNQEWPKRGAGYEDPEGLHKFFVHYRTRDEATDSDFFKLFLLSTTGTVLGSNTDLIRPEPLALWAGKVIAADSESGTIAQI